jgi:hypothetical protein
VRALAKDFCTGTFAIALSALAVLAALAQEPLRIDGLTIPAEVGGFTQGPARDYEAQQPGLGQSVRFTAQPGWTVDVFFYDARLKSIPDDIDSNVQREQFAQARGDIVEAGRRGFYANVQERDAFVVGGAGARRFACAMFNYQRGDKRDVDVDSYVCLTGWNNRFVKIRMTSPRGVMLREDVTRFAEAWISVLSRTR